MKKLIIIFVFLFTSLIVTSSTIVSNEVFASKIIYPNNKINLYETQNSNSKLIEVVNSENILIPIFFEKKSNWIKVANPKNGNVGWVNVKDLEHTTIASSNEFSIKQQVLVDKNKIPHVSRVIETIDPNEQKFSNNDELKKIIKKWKIKIVK